MFDSAGIIWFLLFRDEGSSAGSFGVLLTRRIVREIFSVVEGLMVKVEMQTFTKELFHTRKVGGLERKQQTGEVLRLSGFLPLVSQCILYAWLSVSCASRMYAYTHIYYVNVALPPDSIVLEILYMVVLKSGSTQAYAYCRTEFNAEISESIDFCVFPLNFF